MRSYDAGVVLLSSFAPRRLAGGLAAILVACAPTTARSTLAENSRQSSDHPGKADGRQVAPSGGAAGSEGGRSRPAASARDPAADAHAAARERMLAGDPAGAIAACAPALTHDSAAARRCRLLAAAAHLQRREWDRAAALLRPARGTFGPLEP